MSRRQRRKEQREKESKSLAQVLFGWAFQIVVVILFAYVVVYFFGQSRTNIGQSMDPTLSGGDVVLINELSYRFGSPSRNDVIAFRPNGSQSSHSYMKRVIGLPGETIQIRNGMIYINGNAYLEDEDYPDIENAGIAEEPITLGEEEYFVLGDNRNNSEDSRFADIGCVKQKDIEGKVWMVVSPREHIRLVK